MSLGEGWCAWVRRTAVVAHGIAATSKLFDLSLFLSPKLFAEGGLPVTPLIQDKFRMGRGTAVDLLIASEHASQVYV